MSVVAARIEEETPEPDVTGVPSTQLQALYEEYLDTDPMAFAERIGIDYNFMVRLCVKPRTPVVSLYYAEKILDGLGLNITDLDRRNEIAIVPLNASRKAAERMVEAQIAGIEDDLQYNGEAVTIDGRKVTAADYVKPSKEQKHELAVFLMEEYAYYCPITPFQEEHRERARTRMAALRAKRKGGS